MLDIIEERSQIRPSTVISTTANSKMAVFSSYDDEDYCADCDDYGTCSGLPCEIHPLVTLGVKDLEDALHNGILWGDIYAMDEEMRLEVRTPEQVKAEEQKMVLQDKRMEESIKSYEVDKRKKLYTTAEGVAKKKFNWPCKKQQYDGGCWLHAEKHGACSFIHTDEEEEYTKIFSQFKTQGYYNTDASLRKSRDVKEGRCLFVTGVDDTGALKFAQTNQVISEKQQQPAVGLIRVPFRNMGGVAAPNKTSICAW